MTNTEHRSKSVLKARVTDTAFRDMPNDYFNVHSGGVELIGPSQKMEDIDLYSKSGKLTKFFRDCDAGEAVYKGLKRAGRAVTTFSAYAVMVPIIGLAEILGYMHGLETTNKSDVSDLAFVADEGELY